MASASLSGFSMTGWNVNSFRPQLTLPPVTYPPCCGKGLTCSYFMQSKIMALAFLILGISFFVCFICAFLPYWFILDFSIADSTFGSEGLRQLTADLGILFYTDDDYISLVFLEKMTNRQVVPGLFKVAQITEVLSIAVVGCSFAGAGILAFRKYSSLTGALFLAALGTVGAVGQIMMVVFSMASLLSSANDLCEPEQLGCTYRDNQAWRNLPFKEQYRRINQETTPKMEANWGLYIAIIGAVLAVVGCVLLWIEGLMICRTVGTIRYQQLRQKRDMHENDRHPNDYIYSPPAGLRAPPRQTYRPPPSMSGSSVQSGGVVFSPREIDL